MDFDNGLERELSDLKKMRLDYVPQLPLCLQGTSVRVECGDATSAIDPSDAQTIGRLFPHTYGQPLVRFLSDTAELPSSSSSHNLTPMRVGVVFCGRQSPGGNNVVWGIYNALKTHNPDSVLLGFLCGSEGLFEQKALEITDDILSTYKNQGAYDLLGRNKDQIRIIEKVNDAMATCTSLKLDGLAIIGGVTSNTDAAQLAEAFAEAKCQTKVVGVPVTLNGDLKNQFVETNVGFDTICKVSSQLISNVCTDSLSAEKCYHFIRLMGGKASHVALECTLQSHPNMVILCEEVSASKLTLSDLTKQICDTVQARAEQDKYHGVVLLPEGLIESIPEVYALLQEIHALLEQGVSVDKISSQLSPSVSVLFDTLPPFTKEQLLLSPESDDSAQLSQIEPEKLLAHLVEIEMDKRLKEETYKGKKFNAVCHLFGNQARESLPSKFDCDYAFVLGHVCYHTLVAGLTGYLATVTNLKNPVDRWCCCAAPITAMMTLKHIEPGPGASSPGKPALHPAAVDLKGKAYDLLRQNATKFLMDDVYRNTGPLQFDGPGVDLKSATLCVEDQDCMRLVNEEEVVVNQVTSETSTPSASEIDNQNTTAAAELVDVRQSHDQEETINSEPMAVSELREEDEVPEAIEYVLVDSKDGFPTSKPEEEVVLVTKNPSDGQIQDPDVQSDFLENENCLHATSSFAKSESIGGDLLFQEATVQYGSSGIDNYLQSPVNFLKPETEAGDTLRPVYNAVEGEEEKEPLVIKSPCDCPIEDAAVQNSLFENDSNNFAVAEEIEEASVTINPCDCRVEDAAIQYGSSEIDNYLQSPVDFMKPETEVSDIRPVYYSVEGEEEKEASVIKSPCDCPIEDAAVQNSLFENDSNNFVVAEEIEEALVTINSCDCQVEDAAIQNDSLKNGANLHSPGDLMKTETKGDDHLCLLKNVTEAEAEEEALISSDIQIQDAAVQTSKIDYNLHSPGDFVTPEIVGDELLCPVKKIAEAKKEDETSGIKVPGDTCIQDAAVQKKINANDNILHSPGEFKTPETDEEEKGLAIKNLGVFQIQDAGVLNDSSENGNDLHSPDNSAKPETEEGDLLCRVNNGAEVEVEVTKAVNEDSEVDVEVTKAVNTETSSHPLAAGVLNDSSEYGNDLHSPDNSVKPETEEGDLLCRVNNGAEVEVEVTKTVNEDSKVEVEVTKAVNTETSSHPLAAGVVIPVVGHADGGLVQDVTSRSVTEMISDSKIQNSSSANGMNTSCIDAAVISRASVQFGSFVPAIYQVNGVCGDDVSKPSSSLEVVSATPKVEPPVAVEVESVERPFNFLIRIPKYYDDELNEQIRLAVLQVADKTQNRDNIKFKMQVIRGTLQQTRNDYAAKASEERDARRFVKLKRQEIDSVQSIINRVKNAISVEDIDTRIKHMEHMMQHETLDLKEEKQFIREIKQLKLYREQLSSNMGSQDEVRKAIDERDQIEEQLKTLKKDLERLKQKVVAAEATAVAADTKLKEGKKNLEELHAQHVSAQNLRQIAFMNLQNLKKQFYEKNARFRNYKNDAAAAIEYASNRNKGALHRLCLNQVEKMMELWNNDDEFRKEYVRCNTRSTMLWRLRTMDGRAPGPDEEPHVVTSFVDERIKSSHYRVGQVNPELPLVSTGLDRKEEPLPTTQAITECKPVEKVSEQTNKAEKVKKTVNPSIRNIAAPINSSVEVVETLEEVNNKKQTKEEQEVIRKEEQSRKAVEQAKLKEQRRLEEIAKAKEALERKKRQAEKAQIKAEVRAQKEAEQKDKEKEKRAKKKERKKAGVGGDEDIIAPMSDLTVVTTMKEPETKEVNPSAAGAVTTSKKPHKAFTKQLNKIKSVSSMPPPLRNKNKRKWHQWIWLAVCAMFVMAVVFFGNMGMSFYPNHLGRNRHPGF